MNNRVICLGLAALSVFSCGTPPVINTGGGAAMSGGGVSTGGGTTMSAGGANTGGGTAIVGGGANSGGGTLSTGGGATQSGGGSNATIDAGIGPQPSLQYLSTPVKTRGLIKVVSFPEKNEIHLFTDWPDAPFNKFGMQYAKLNYQPQLLNALTDGGLPTLENSTNITIHSQLSFDVDDSSRPYFAGYTAQNTAQFQVVVTRFAATGGLDTTYGTNGYAKFSVMGAPNSGVQSLGANTVSVLKALPGGSVLIAGIVRNTNNVPGWFVAKLTSAGALDPTFGTNGIQFIDALCALGNRCLPMVVAIGNTGEIVVAGRETSTTTSFTKVMFLRLSQSGQRDLNFGTSGVATDVSYSQRGVNDMLVMTDGSVVFAGEATDTTGANRHQTLIGKLTPAGSLDATFGTMGLSKLNYYEVLPTSPTAYNDFPHRLWLDGSDGIIVGGLSIRSTGTIGYLTSTRLLLSNGEVDALWGGDTRFVRVTNSGIAGILSSGNPIGILGSVFPGPNGVLNGLVTQNATSTFSLVGWSR